MVTLTPVDRRQVVAIATSIATPNHLGSLACIWVGISTDALLGIEVAHLLSHTRREGLQTVRKLQLAI